MNSKPTIFKTAKELSTFWLPPGKYLRIFTECFPLELWLTDEGVLHNANGPALKNKERMEYYEHGLLHRIDGPAIEQLTIPLLRPNYILFNYPFDDKVDYRQTINQKTIEDMLFYMLNLTRKPRFKWPVIQQILSEKYNEERASSIIDALKLI